MFHVLSVYPQSETTRLLRGVYHWRRFLTYIQISATFAH
jgi:hypothetical protein